MKRLSVAIEVIAPVFLFCSGMVVTFDFVRHNWFWFWLDLELGIGMAVMNAVVNIRRSIAIRLLRESQQNLQSEVEKVVPIIVLLTEQTVRQYGAVRALVGLPLATRRNVAISQSKTP